MCFPFCLGGGLVWQRYTGCNVWYRGVMWCVKWIWHHKLRCLVLYGELFAQSKVRKASLLYFILEHFLHPQKRRQLYLLQTTLFRMSHPLHASHHTPIWDIAPTVSLSSQPLHWYHTHFWMTSDPPSVWHSMPYIEHHILSLCHHSTVLTTSKPLYMKPHPVRTATYTLYKRHHSQYLCPHTQSIDNITTTLCMTSHSPYVWHLLPYTNHHILILWHQTSMFMSSQPLYLTSCPLCVDGSSHPLYWWYDNNCISEITSAIVHNIISIVYDMTPTVYAFMASDTLHITSPPGFMTCPHL